VPANSLYLLVAYLITLPSVLIAGAAAPSSDLIAALKVACLAAFFWHAAQVLRGKPRERASVVALAAATGLLWCALLVMYLYKVVALAPLDFSMVVAAMHDARRTLVHVLGQHGVLIAAGALGTIALSASGASWALLRALRARASRLRGGPRSAVACVGILGYFIAGDLWYAAEELVLYPRAYSVESPYLPALLSVPDHSALPIRSRQSVFVLQLESVNSLAVFDPAAQDLQRQRKVPQPGLEAILKEGGGVLFPLFWANGTQTHRAWESILCGVSGNLGPAMSSDPTRLARVTCLPGHLAAGGYEALWLYSYFNLEFFNLGEFARKAGFRDVLYGPKLMREGDPRHQWGYDDCAFYERAFDQLARKGLDKRERLFAYFEVGMHHAPFLNSRKHPQAHPYPDPDSMLEHYLNSNAEQDHCLAVFWKRFKQLGRDDVHLFILPDHSLWVPGVPVHPDSAFATWLVYVPPARRAAEFKARTVLSPTPSQAQLYPTILELLEGAALPGSFAFALRGEPPPSGYQDCHLLTDGSHRLVVHKGAQRGEFRVSGGSVVVPGSPLKADFWGFRESFACN
jgi:Sulfatase